MNIIKLIDEIADFKYNVKDKLTNWKKKHIFATDPYWSVIPTMQIGENDVYIYFLKWGVKF